MANNLAKKYAVIKIQGHQYRIEEGQEILVDRLKDPQKVEPEVLLLVDETKVKVGKPKVSGVKIGLKVLKEEEKGEKLYVQRFKAKSRYRKRTGFRPQYTRLLVQKISA